MKNKNKNSARFREILSVLRRHDIVHGISPVKLRSILEDLGPTYVKLGQIMSMRSDILPEEYCNELKKLRTDVKPMDFSVVLSTIKSEYGMNYDKVFSYIDEQSVGSASIAQVHRAKLLDGTDVVIKIQRPNVKETMSEDIAMIKKVTGILKHVGDINSVLDFDAVINELWIVSQQEMDFLIEAENCREFKNINNGIEYISSPEVYLKYTTQKILVMDYIDGIRIDDVKTLKELGYDMIEIGSKLSENYIKQVLDDGFFHADPHPGNIWISGGKIVWLDLGMMGRFSRSDMEIMKTAVLAVVTGDIYELKAALLSLGSVKGKVNHAQLYTDIDDMVERYLSIGIGDINMGDVVFELIDIAKRHNIKMPATITMFARGLITFEGVISVCCPDLRLVDTLSAHASKEFAETFNVKKELKIFLRDLYGSAKKSVGIPASAADLIKMMIKGQAKINLELIGADEPLEKINHMVHETIISIIISATIIASSMICTTQMQPKILGIPALGALGFFAAFIMGVMLIIKITKRRGK